MGIEMYDSRIILITASQIIMHGKLTEKSPITIDKIEGCAYQSQESGRNHFIIDKTSIVSWSWHESMKGVVFIQDYWMGNQEGLDERPQSDDNFQVSFFSKFLGVIFRSISGISIPN
jgi:hypothetical protein